MELIQCKSELCEKILSAMSTSESPDLDFFGEQIFQLEQNLKEVEKQCEGWEGVLVKRKILEFYLKHNRLFNVPANYFNIAGLDESQHSLQQQWLEERGERIILILRAKSHDAYSYKEIGNEILSCIQQKKWSLEDRMLLLEHYLQNRALRLPNKKQENIDLAINVIDEFLSKDLESTTGDTKGELLIKLIEIFHKSPWYNLDFFTMLKGVQQTSEIQQWMNEKGHAIHEYWKKLSKEN